MIKHILLLITLVGLLSSASASTSKNISGCTASKCKQQEHKYNHKSTFKENLDNAIIDNIETGKYIYLFITQKDCEFCKEQKKIHKMKKIKEALEDRFIFMEVDKFDIPKDSDYYPIWSPTIFIINDEKVIEKLYGFQKYSKLKKILEKLSPSETLKMLRNKNSKSQKETSEFFR